MQNKELKKNSEVLRKCAFCGGEARWWDTENEKYPYQIYCTHCYCGTDKMAHEEYAIERWNNRKQLERVIEQIQELANEFQEGYYHEVHCKSRMDKCKWKDCCACVLERAIEIIKEELM